MTKLHIWGGGEGAAGLVPLREDCAPLSHLLRVPLVAQHNSSLHVLLLLLCVRVSSFSVNLIPPPILLGYRHSGL